MDVYSIITNKVIENLEKGIIPWKKPWIGNKGAYNRISGKSYSILNQMLLEHEGEYLTFNQITALNGKVKKGAKSEMVVFFKMNEYEEEKDGEVNVKRIPILRYYSVFHISNVTGIEPLEVQDINVNVDDDEFPELSQVVENYLSAAGIKYIISERSKACYNSKTDTVEIPKDKQFINMNGYYSVFFHEIVHSTGHEKRLNRSLANGFGSEAYAKEELIAELGSVYLNNHYSVETTETFDNSTAYIQSWLKALRNDKKLIVTASTQAEKAANYVLSVA